MRASPRGMPPSTKRWPRRAADQCSSGASRSALTELPQASYALAAVVARSWYAAVAQEVLTPQWQHGPPARWRHRRLGQRREAASELVGRCVIRGIPLSNDCRQPSHVPPRSLSLVVHPLQLFSSYLIPLRASVHTVKPLVSSQEDARARWEQRRWRPMCWNAQPTRAMLSMWMQSRIVCSGHDLF
jgi:hypothetical protein